MADLIGFIVVGIFGAGGLMAYIRIATREVDDAITKK